jgi:mRNA interferase MazF
MSNGFDILLKPRKRFAHWLWVKRDIEETDHTPPLFKEGEVWWCYAGENVGIETNGKGDAFTRPFLIFKKYDNRSFLGLPLSTSVKRGSRYVTIRFNKSDQTVNVAQGRAFDYRRLKEKFDRLSANDFRNVERGYAELHFIALPKIDLPPLRRESVD